MSNTEIAVGKSADKSAALLVTSIAVFLTGSAASSINVALPTIGKDFALNAVVLGWIVNVYSLTAAVLLVPLGRIADIYGRKKILTIGILIYTVSSFFLAISVSGAMLIALRIVQGVGAAMLFTTAPAILTSVFPPGERGKVLGINVAVVYIGLSSGPFLGGILTQHFGWRSIFWINVPLGLVAIMFVFWRLRGEWTGARGDRFDLGGSAIYSLSVAAVMCGFSLLPAMAGLWLLPVGILGILAFIRWETRASSPVLDLNLFRGNTVFTLSNLAALVSYSATYGVTFLLSLYLQYTKGLGAESAGLVLVAMPAMQAVFSPVAGRFSDKVEPRILASVGMALTTLGLALLIFLKQNTEIGYILGSLMILGFGFALFSSPNTNAVMSSVDRGSYGVASATLATMRQIGNTLSIAIAMLIFTIYIGKVEITPEYYSAFLASVKTAFTVFAILCFAGVFASLARGKVR